MRLHRTRRRFALSAALAVVLGTAALPASSLAASSPNGGPLLTLAARVCPSYGDITANLARNNIMESLRDLGPDTPYRHGEPVDPEVEERVQPKCRPLPGWRFTLGSSYISRAVSGPWGALSIVRGQLREPLVTRRETPLLGSRGEPTGRQIAGATTLALGEREAGLAASSSLWVQGGTTTDPVLNGEFPGPQYGFGALRCATDNVNGDNVEYVAYPSGTTHVFCFAYYVEPPPTSGTIVVRKEAVGSGAPNETFNFDGNLSYNPGGRFSLSPRAGAPASETFYRGATGANHEPWTVRELGAVDWRLTDLTCTSRDHASQITTSQDSGSATISLGAEDLVTCTYRNEYSPPAHGLLIRKLSEGGVGSFGYSVEPVGSGHVAEARATTREEGVAVDADPSPLDLSPGAYRIVEQLPESSQGHWKLAAVECDGKSQEPEGPIEVTVSARDVASCTFTNRFLPDGSIAISKITRGATGTSGFEILPPGENPAVLKQSATTTAEGVAVRAHGDSSEGLGLGEYSVTDSPPPPAGGEWQLAEVECDGEVVPFAEGRIEVALTAAHPHRHCTFTNVFRPTAEPTPPRSAEPTPLAHLVLHKREVTPNPEVDQVVEYEIEVRNTGPGEALDVGVIDQPLGSATLAAARPSSGTCSEALPLQCSFGTLAPGAGASVRVRLVGHRRGQLINRAVADTSSYERDLGSSEAEAPVRLAPPRASVPPEPGLG